MAKKYSQLAGAPLYTDLPGGPIGSPLFLSLEPFLVWNKTIKCSSKKTKPPMVSDEKQRVGEKDKDISFINQGMVFQGMDLKSDRDKESVSVVWE